MKTLGSILFLAVSAIPASQELDDRAQEDQVVQAGDVGERLVEWVQSSASVGFSGAVLAAVDGEVVTAVAVGSADLDGEVPNTPATLFEIASATKQFTGAAAAKLAQDGRLDLDESIDEHLPKVPKDCRGITVRHLLNNTSGIPGTNSEGHGDRVERVIKIFLRGGPVHEPGTHWEYWNQGFALATEVVARTAEKDFVTFCKEELFEPAGMRVTCLNGDDPPPGTTVAIGRSPDGDRSALDHPYGNSYGFQYRGMGGAVTNVWDLWRWDRALHGDEVLDEKGKKELFEVGLKDYALGWYVERDSEGRLVHRHGGGVRGFTADVQRYPEQDACLFVLTNRSRYPVFRVTKALEEILFGDDQTIQPPPRPLDADTVEAIVGAYRDADRNDLTISAEGEVTHLKIEWAGGRWPDTRAYLGLDEEGELVLYEWISTTPVKLERRGKKVKGLTLGDRPYKRR